MKFATDYWSRPANTRISNNSSKISTILSVYNNLLTSHWVELHKDVRRNNGILELSDNEFKEARSKLGNRIPEILEYRNKTKEMNDYISKLNDQNYKPFIDNNNRSLETIQGAIYCFQRDEASFEELQQSLRNVEHILSNLPKHTESFGKIVSGQKGKEKVNDEGASGSEEIVLAIDENN